MNLAWKTIGGLALGLLLVGQGCPATQPSKKADEVKSKPAMEEKKSGEVMEKKDEGAVMEKKKGEAMEKKEGGATEKKGEGTITEKKEGDAMMKKESVMMSKDLALNAEALGGGAVKLTWEAPTGLNESNRFIIVRDEMENPEHTGNNFWIRQSHLKREVVWEMNPTGTWRFRLCLTENDEKDVCTKYSNDVEVEVE